MNNDQKRDGWVEQVPIYFALKNEQRMGIRTLKVECEDWTELSDEQREAIRKLVRPITRQTYQRAWGQLHPRVLTPEQKLRAKIRRCTSDDKRGEK